MSDLYDLAASAVEGNCGCNACYSDVSGSSPHCENGPHWRTSSERLGSALMQLWSARDLAREKLQGPKAWLDLWADHIGNCRGGQVCTCGLTLARAEIVDAAAALDGN
jgi:hypothetical protein